jgi:Ran GTPase-activating protein (RanGAP) involved in mRNA processing and transport
MLENKKKLISLGLEYNNIQGEGLGYLSEAIVMTKSLQRLYLNNNILDLDAMMYLCESLK